MPGRNYRAHKPTLDNLFKNVKKLLELKAHKFHPVADGGYAFKTVRVDRGRDDSVPGLLWTYEITGGDVTLIGVEPWDVIL